MCFWQNDKAVSTKNYEIYASNSDQKEMKFLPQNKVPKVFVWTLRMQFWQWNRKNLPQGGKKVVRNLVQYMKLSYSRKKSYPQNDPLDTYSAFLTTSPICLNCFPQRSSSNYLIITFRSRKFFTIMFFIYRTHLCQQCWKIFAEKMKNIVLF